jgi:hypothetical protein
MSCPVAWNGMTEPRRERRERKPAERFFTAWRRVPRNGTQEKAGRPSVQNDAGLQRAAMICITVRSAGLKSHRLLAEHGRPDGCEQSVEIVKLFREHDAKRR